MILRFLDLISLIVDMMGFFQVKKCNEEDAKNCWYCSLNPPRLPEELLKDLHFVPDPVLTGDADERYKDFSDVYGNETNDSDRPSLKASATQGAEADKGNRTLFNAAKV